MIDRKFNPPREFWGAMTEPIKCYRCGSYGNGSLRKWQLLDGPVDASCWKCGSKWSIAIPLGDCEERRNIEALLAAEARFYKLREELADTVDLLRGPLEGNIV